MKALPFLSSCLLLIVCAALTNATMAQVARGDAAPPFEATNYDGSTWRLQDHIGNKVIVLYFYPAAMTGGCTKQACSYRDSENAFSKQDALVVGISGDTPEGQHLFREVHNLNFPLLSDADGSIAAQYGVPVKEGGSITREVNGAPVVFSRGATTARWTFVINKEGKVAYINKTVNAEQDSDEVLEVIESLD
jgi:peroxiredoxin Q/BCP